MFVLNQSTSIKETSTSNHGISKNNYKAGFDVFKWYLQVL